MYRMDPPPASAPPAAAPVPSPGPSMSWAPPLSSPLDDPAELQKRKNLAMRFQATSVLCKHLQREPALLSVMHIYHLLLARNRQLAEAHARRLEERRRLLARAKKGGKAQSLAPLPPEPEQTQLTNVMLVTAWADMNDLVYVFGGHIPFEIYDRVLETYGHDAAILMVNADNNIIEGTALPPKNRTRKVKLLDLTEELRQLLAQEPKADAMSLCRFLAVCDNYGRSVAPEEGGLGPGHNSAQEFVNFADADVLGRWASKCMGQPVGPPKPFQRPVAAPAPARPAASAAAAAAQRPVFQPWPASASGVMRPGAQSTRQWAPQLPHPQLAKRSQQPQQPKQQPVRQFLQGPQQPQNPQQPQQQPQQRFQRPG